MLPSCFLNFDVLDFATPELLQCLFLASFRPVDARYNLEGYATLTGAVVRNLSDYLAFVPNSCNCFPQVLKA